MTAIPAARLREAAEELRGWIAEAPAQPWAPGAVAAFGPELVELMETAATYLGDEPQVAYPSHVVRALALADAILAAVAR